MSRTRRKLVYLTYCSGVFRGIFIQVATCDDRDWHNVVPDNIIIIPRAVELRDDSLMRAERDLASCIGFYNAAPSSFSGDDGKEGRGRGSFVSTRKRKVTIEHKNESRRYTNSNNNNNTERQPPPRHFIIVALRAVDSIPTRVRHVGVV